MHDDDAQVGRILSRREVLALLGVAGASAFGAGDPLLRARPTSAMRIPACVVRPEQTEGPYFVDEKLNRSDIRPDPATGSVPEGAYLDLTLNVSRVGADGCQPLEDAIVDIWQCDAQGVYSDVRDTAGRFDTVGRKFLRGHQRTDAEGAARFVTIYPGWYEGRTVHIHFKIRTTIAERAYDFTSQLYFDDALTDRVLAQAPYASRSGRRIRNAEDGIYRSGGDRLMLAVTPREAGYAATFDIGLQPG